MRPIFFDPVLQQRFDRDGYVRVPMLSPRQVSAVLDDMSGMRPADAFAPEGPGVTYHCSFLDRNRAYREQVWKRLGRAFESVLAPLLLDYEMLQANFYVKPPGRGNFGLHQNWPILADLKQTSLTIWCPLVDVDERNGALQFVPGSHKITPHVQGPESVSYFSQILPDIQPFLRSETLRAGEAIVFDDSLIHGSGPNLTDAPRIAVQLICIPRGSQPTFYYKQDETTFELIEAPCSFWLENDISDLRRRKDEWRSRGFVKSANRLLDATEFAVLIENGEEIRRAGFRLEPVLPSALAD